MTIPVRRLGVVEAAQKAARLLGKDMGPLWLVGAVSQAIVWLPFLLGKATPFVTGEDAIDRLEPYWSVPYQVLLVMPITAGLFFAVGRRIDRQPARVKDLFEVFGPCYWPSVVAGLPIVLLTLLGLLIMGAPFFIQGAASGLLGESAGARAPAAIAAASCCILLPVLVGVLIGAVLVVFALLAVWDTPHSGIQAIRASVRVAWRHFWSVLGAYLLFLVAAMGVTSPGWIAYPACVLVAGGGHAAAAKCIGIAAFAIVGLLTLPLVTVWNSAMLIHLYRSWTGQAAVQPAAAPSAAPGAGTAAGE